MVGLSCGGQGEEDWNGEGGRTLSPVRRLGPGRKVLESLTGEFRAGRKEALQILSHRMTA